jgi:dTDP-glucose 4,6-dehydratase
VRILVTGGAGFIGSCLVRALVDRGRDDVVVLDALTYAGNPENLAGLEASGRYRFVHGSIGDEAVVADAIDGCDAVINVAAETHVDRSIDEPGVFLDTNVQGPRVLMDAVRARGGRFVQVSTDEVYGDLEERPPATEDSPLAPSSPYAASKAAADLLVGSYCRTYGLDAVVTRCGNNYGPRQFPEKLVPLFITNALEDRELPLYGDGLNVRDWIHVEDHCAGILAALERGRAGRIYNISAGCTLANREVCRTLLELLGKPQALVRKVADRPGHDRRYALDAGRIRAELGWKPQVPFAEGLAATVDWYRVEREWWQRVKSGEYRRFYDKLYGDRLKADRAAPPKPGSRR